MRKFLSRNWFHLLIAAFLIFDCVILFYNFFISKQKKAVVPPIQVKAEFLQKQMEASDFYNRLCPEISIKSFDDKEINLSDLRGNVIIIKFSKFAQTELPNLIFMEHIAEKYKTCGVSLIFINSSGRHDYETISQSCYFDYPIVEDDGLISGYFNANIEDTIIIDRNFYIKFKHHLFNKKFILNAFKKWAFEETIPTEDTSEEELESILQRTS